MLEFEQGQSNRVTSDDKFQFQSGFKVFQLSRVLQMLERISIYLILISQTSLYTLVLYPYIKRKHIHTTIYDETSILSHW